MSQIVCSALGGNVGEKLDSFFQRKNCFIEVNPGHVIMPKKYQDISEEVINSDVRSDDIWMISYPRTGLYQHLNDPNCCSRKQQICFA